MLRICLANEEETTRHPTKARCSKTLRRTLKLDTLRRSQPKKNGNTGILQMAGGKVPACGGVRHRRRAPRYGHDQTESKRRRIRQPLPRHERHRPPLLSPRRAAPSQELRRRLPRRFQLHRPHLLHCQAPQASLPRNRSVF
jgi:hypothetical protein